MKKAIKFLKDYKYKTYEVSQMVGYTNPKNFTRTFKSYYGMGPREYRNSNPPKQYLCKPIFKTFWGGIYE